MKSLTTQRQDLSAQIRKLKDGNRKIQRLIQRIERTNAELRKQMNPPADRSTQPPPK